MTYNFESVTKSTTFEYSLSTPNGPITISILKTESDVYFPYIKGVWTGDKECTLRGAVDSCLRYLGVPSKQRALLLNHATQLQHDTL